MHFNQKRIKNLQNRLTTYEPNGHLEMYYYNELNNLVDDVQELIDVLHFYANSSNYKYYDVEINNGFKYTTSKIDEDGGKFANEFLEDFNAETFNK